MATTRKEFHLFPFRYNNTYLRTGPDLNLPAESLDTSFKLKYPPDEWGKELDDSARVWRVYRDEAISHDDKAVEAWTNTVDILLTFAGLFSAVVTAFVIESYQQLRPDSSNAHLVAALYSLLVTATNATDSRFLSAPTSPPTSSLGVRLVNGLWFTSLFLSLSAALLCMLVKQWLDKYLERMRPQAKNPKHWSRRRAFYFQGLEAWRVADIISCIPVLLHIAVFCFLGGLGSLLWPLDHSIAAWVVSCSTLAGLLYVLSIAMASRDEAWPFTTTLTDQLSRIFTLVHIRALGVGLIVFEAGLTAASCLLGVVRPHPQSIHLWVSAKILQATIEKPTFDQLLEQDILRNGYEIELDYAKPSLADNLDYEALCWLILSVSDSDASAAGFQAIGALEPRSLLLQRFADRNIFQVTSRREWLLASSAVCGALEAARVVKTLLPVTAEDAPGTNQVFVWDRLNVIRRYENLLHLGQPYPDLQLIRHALYLPLQGSLSYMCNDYDYRALVRAHTAGEWQRCPYVHETAILLATLRVFHPYHIFLLLLFCDLGRVTVTQWRYLMSTLLGNSRICPRPHQDPTVCDVRCLLELLSEELLQYCDVSPDKDTTVVLRRLFDVACVSVRPSTPLSSVPTFLRYIGSDRFVLNDHSAYPSLGAMAQVLDPSSLDRVVYANATWFRAWHHAAYVSYVQSRPVYCPTEIFLSVFWEYLGKHIQPAACRDWDQFHPPDQYDTIAQIIFSPAQHVDTRIPNIWELIVNMLLASRLEIVATTETLASFLCARSRQGVDFGELITGFLGPMTFSHLMILLYSTRERYGDAETVFRPTEFCAHIMELRPSWWIDGMNRLLHEDRYEFAENHWEERNILPDIQEYAATITAQCLRRGPCYDCPVKCAPLSFESSLRTSEFTVFPFAVFPIVDL